MVVAKRIHDYVCPWPSVVDVAKDVQLINDQPLNDLAYCDDKVVGATSSDYSPYYCADIITFVLIVGTLMKQLLYYIGEILRQVLSYF